MENSKPDSQKIITENFNLTEGSFIYFLHEKNVFDKKTFIELLSSINDINELYSKDELLPRKLCREIVFIMSSFDALLHGYLERYFRKDYRAHLALEHFKYKERLDFAIDGFFNNHKYNEAIFEPFDDSAKL